MYAMRCAILVGLLLLACADCAPFFDAIYDAISGNGRRSYGYGYDNYGPGYGYNGYNGNNGYGYNGYRRAERPQRQGKTFKEICRVHYPDAVAFPGAGGIVCPY